MRVKLCFNSFNIENPKVVTLANAIRMVRGSHRIKFPNYLGFLPLRILFETANSADPDEMQHIAAFHLGLH